MNELIGGRRWVLLADGLEHLDGPSRELVVAKLANATSVYFTVTPRIVDDVYDLMRRNKYMHIPYVDGSIQAGFDTWNTTEGTTALGVLAALKTIAVPGDTKHLHFGYLFL